MPLPKKQQFLQEVVEPDVQPVQEPEVLTEEAPLEEAPKKKRFSRKAKK